MLALASGSPAIDAGSNPLALDTDQRGVGYARGVVPAADIGAYETQPPADVIFVDGSIPEPRLRLASRRSLHVVWIVPAGALRARLFPPRHMPPLAF